MVIKQQKRYINKSLRLKEYNYNCPGAYFVTICIKDKKCLFGNVENGKMVLNESGIITKKCLEDIPEHFENVEITEHVVMPNHVHAIVNIYGDDDIAGQTHAFDSQRRAFDLQGDRKHQKLPIIIGSYKSAVSKEVNKHYPLTNFKWQPSYHDHIIRNEKAMENIQNYIILNPENWMNDLENDLYRDSISKKERERKIKQFYKDLSSNK